MGNILMKYIALVALFQGAEALKLDHKAFNSLSNQ